LVTKLTIQAFQLEQRLKVMPITVRVTPNIAKIYFPVGGVGLGVGPLKTIGVDELIPLPS
jgi:hypothetical protein